MFKKITSSVWLVGKVREKVLRDVTGEKPRSHIREAFIGQGKNLRLCSQYEKSSWVCKELHFKGTTPCCLETRLGVGHGEGKNET